VEELRDVFASLEAQVAPHTVVSASVLQNATKLRNFYFYNTAVVYSIYYGAPEAKLNVLQWYNK
jgi:hypothetical protein